MPRERKLFALEYDAIREGVGKFLPPIERTLGKIRERVETRAKANTLSPQDVLKKAQGAKGLMEARGRIGYKDFTRTEDYMMLTTVLDLVAGQNMATGETLTVGQKEERIKSLYEPSSGDYLYHLMWSMRSPDLMPRAKEAIRDGVELLVANADRIGIKDDNLYLDVAPIVVLPLDYLSDGRADFDHSLQQLNMKRIDLETYAELLGSNGFDENTRYEQVGFPSSDELAHKLQFGYADQVREQITTVTAGLLAGIASEETFF